MARQKKAVRTANLDDNVAAALDRVEMAAEQTSKDARTIRTKVQDLQLALDDLKVQYESDVNALEAKIREAEERHEREQEKLRSEHEREMSKLETRHASEVGEARGRTAMLEEKLRRVQATLS